MGWDLISGRVWFCQVGQGVVSFGISFLGGYLYIFWVYKCFKACDTLSKGRSTLYNHSTISFYKKYLSTIHSHHFLLRMAKCLQKEQQHHSNCRTGKWQRKMNKMNSSSMVMKWSNNGKPPRRATGRDIAVEMTGSADIAIHRMLWPHVVWRWVLAVPLSAHKYLALLPVFFPSLPTACRCCDSCARAFWRILITRLSKCRAVYELLKAVCAMSDVRWPSICMQTRF